MHYVILSILLAGAFGVWFILRAPVGTRSLLIGVHQFLWHPVTVWFAWVRFYREFPSWKECVCIFVHDWGYWGCHEMDGPEGSEHTALGADIAFKLLDRDEGFRHKRWRLGAGYGMGRRRLLDSYALDEGFHYYRLVRWHSRHLAEEYGIEPSKLCWPDKTSMIYEPEWFYILRARLSGEIHEYRHNAAGGRDGIIHLPRSASDREWLRWLRTRLARLAEQEGAKFRARAATPEQGHYWRALQRRSESNDPTNAGH